MQRMRSIWLALVGGAVILAFSVSAALGAPPTEADGPRGQSISAFVHELVFGSEDQTDEDEVVEEDEEDVSDEDLTDEEEGDTADSERQVPEEFANHGECVSEAAQDTEGFEASGATNHGEWVSTHARYDCWGLEPPDAQDQEASVDEEGDTESAAAKEEREAAKAERRAAREAAKAERQAAREAAKAERQAGEGH